MKRIPQINPSSSAVVGVLNHLPEDACPDCWGYVEYDGLVCTQATAVRPSASSRKGWILRYAEERLPGFRRLRQVTRRLTNTC